MTMYGVLQSVNSVTPVPLRIIVVDTDWNINEATSRVFYIDLIESISFEVGEYIETENGRDGVGGFCRERDWYYGLGEREDGGRDRKV
jgi:hypothetical protein